MKVRTRFAPSPTGSLHVGGIRTALFNWLFARKNKGIFILRIEDTDVERSTEQSAQGIIESLNWLGLDWDEGPYFQSQRLDIYNEHLIQLKEKGLIYPAFETKEELEAIRQKAILEKRNPIYDRSSLKYSSEEVAAKMAAGQKFVWRFKVPDEGYTEIPELLMAGADYKLKNDSIGDFVITRPGSLQEPGMPLYNFVCTVDDALMNITHVIRGVEHLPNAAKQVLLYKALGYEAPKFVHLPLIMKHGKKMSKRDKDANIKFPVSALERRDLGYLPEATLNHLALLGWSPEDNQEIFCIEKLKMNFSLDRLSKANANFDEDKYYFLNSYYIKEMNIGELTSMALPFLTKENLDTKKVSSETLMKLIAMQRGRVKILSEFPEALKWFFDKPKTYDEKGLKKFFEQDANLSNQIISKTIENIKAMPLFDLENIENMLKKSVADLEVPFAKYGPVVRLALTGLTASPGLGEMMDVIGKEETIERLNAAQEFIKKKILV